MPARTFSILLILVQACICSGLPLQAADPLINLNSLPSDLKVPEVTHEVPQPGKRVWQINPGFEKTQIAHALYLPPDWQAGKKLPVIVEYPGNGGYHNQYDDRSRGRVQDCKMGYGLSGGKGVIWISLPFVDLEAGRHALKWWGDPTATADYCKQTVDRICNKFGGDPDNVLLTGFSRGAIAGNFIGLRDPEIASLWKAMLLHSHYDGVREWNYTDSDAESARKRLAHLGTRPQFISHELSTRETEEYLQASKATGQFTFMALPYPNHTDEWVLKDIPERTRARKWLQNIFHPHTAD